MTNNANSSIVKYLRVVEVDDSAKTIKALFGGAPSGNYTLFIRHSGPNQEGLVDAANLPF